MVGELLCPDCGGVIGATEVTEAGAPCKCFVSKRSSKYDRVDTSNETLSAQTTETLPTPATEITTKICRVCGADVAGKKRVKDHLGYYCYECSKIADGADGTDGRIRCGSCGHLTRPDALISYEGTKMCPRCHRERLDLQKQQIKTIGYRGARTRAELAQIYRMVSIIGGLLLVIVISALYALIRHHTH